MVWVTNSMSGCRIASSTQRSYHLETRMYKVYPPPFSSRSRLTTSDAVRYPCLQMEEAGLPAATARLGRPQAPDREPQRVHGTDADQPEEGGEVAGHYVCRVVHPEVEPGKADQEHSEYS